MVTHKYGEFSPEQMEEAKVKLRKSIYFLLVCVDEKTRSGCQNVDVNKVFDNIFYRLNGLGSLLSYPVEIVFVMSLLEEARNNYNSVFFEFNKYKKLILDAGSEILELKTE